MATVAVAPKAAHVPSTMARTRAHTVSKTAGLRSRIVPASVTRSGMTLVASPPWIVHTESTACSADGTERLTTDWSATTTCADTSTGSTANCGCEPCPPRPVIVIVNSDGWAMTGPAATIRLATGHDGQLW